jgi:hypothetical protein
MLRLREAEEGGSHMNKPIHTTNCFDTFIRVAEDCPARSGEEPPPRAGQPTVAGLQYAMIVKAPYKYTSDDVIFATSAPGRDLDAKATKAEKSAARATFFSRGQACMRASSLGKRFGWGVHADSEGRIAIYAVDSKRYQALARDPELTQVRAMRSKRG